MQDINRHLTCTFTEEEPIGGINSSTIDVMLDFQQIELSPYQLLQKAKEELRIQEDQLCEALIKSESILEKLLDSLIENQLLKIDITLANESIRILIKSISRLHREKLGEERTEEMVLKEAVKSAKYASLVNPDSSNANYSRRVEQIMALLEKSERHRAQIEGGSGILFIGPTGAGKSFTIGRLLGCKAKECEHKNRSGQTIYELINPSESSENIPEVGHSISVSQTLYTQGYSEKNNPKLFLLDTAGSSETRGDEYELCGRISLDRVIQSIEAIRAIVFVLPLQAFLGNRGSTLMEFFLAELDRFPTLFRTDSEDHKCAHILVTKKDGSSHDVIKNLREGITLNGYVSEQMDELKRLQASDMDSFAIRNAKLRFMIWKAIQSIQKSGRFDIMEPLNNKKPKTYLEKYSSGSVFNKSNYLSGLGSRALQKKFSDSLGTYARGWSVYLLEKYKKSAESILKADMEIQDLNQKLDEDQLNHQKKLEDLEQNREQFEERLTQYEKAQQNTQNISAEELATLIEDQKKNKLMQEQIAVVSDMLKYWTFLGEAEKKAFESESAIRFAEILAQAAEEEKILLSNGDLSVPIIRVPDPKWGETITTYTTDKKDDEASLQEVRLHKDSERKNEREVKIQDLKGTYDHWVYVHKDFPLIPTDEESRKKFQNQVHQTDFGSTIIDTSDRKDVEIIDRNADLTTTKLIYVFRVNWDKHGGDANKYPYIRINHKIPKKTYYSGNRLPQLANLIQYHRNEKQRAEKSLENDRAEIKRIEKIYRELELQWSALKQKKEDEIHSSLEQLILGVKQELEKIKEQRKELLDEKEKQIEEKQKKEAAEKSNIEVLKREKRKLALVIKTQIQQAKILHKFAQIVTNNPEQIELNDSLANKQDFLQQCKRFLSIFNEATIDELLKQSDQDLGIV